MIKGYLPVTIESSCAITSNSICGLPQGSLCGVTPACPLPHVLSIFPTTFTLSEMISVRALQFVPTAFPLAGDLRILLVSLDGISNYSCLNPVRVNLYAANCTIPTNLPFGGFNIKVTVKNQDSTGNVLGVYRENSAISSILPSTGPALGGSSITLTVGNLSELKNVTFSPSYKSLDINLPALTPYFHQMVPL
jgi:hypothetical protein